MFRAIILISILLQIVSCSTQKNKVTDHESNDVNNNASVQSGQSGTSKMELSSIEALCKDQEVTKGLKAASSQYLNYKDDPEYWNIIGSCFLSDLKFTKARLFFLRSLEEKKNYAPALNNLGVVYWNLGKHYEALSYFKRAEQENGTSGLISYNLARIYQHYGLHNKASEYWSKVSRDKLNVNDINYWASNLALTTKANEAVQIFKSTKQISETHFSLFAIALLKSGNKDEAVAQWKQAKVDEKNLINIYWQLTGGN